MLRYAKLNGQTSFLSENDGNELPRTTKVGRTTIRRAQVIDRAKDFTTTGHRAGDETLRTSQTQGTAIGYGTLGLGPSVGISNKKGLKVLPWVI